MKLLPRNHPSTLQLTFPFGQTLVRAGLVFLLMVGIIEAVMRLPAVQSRLPAPGLGAQDDFIEVNLHVLNTLTKDEPMDCLFFGSSFAWRGIDPIAFNEGYESTTGQSIRCYTVGVRSLIASEADTVVALLIELYHPRLLVYGLGKRAFLIDREAEKGILNDFTETAWVKYKLGDFSLKGWLIDHLASYRYLLALNNWMSADLNPELNDREYLEQMMTKSLGHDLVSRVFSPSMPEEDEEQDTNSSETDFPYPAELAGFQQMLAFHQPSETQILLVGMPSLELKLKPGSTYDELYGEFDATITSYARQYGVLYWPAFDLDIIPDDGWYSPGHLNITGAKVFSQWLGEQVGQAVNEGLLLDPTEQVQP